MTDPHPVPPLAAVVQLGHAAVQRVADLTGTDLVHIKGYAIDPALTWPGRVGTDVDVLVRPGQVRDFLHRLVEAGWERVIGFRAGSSFAHAATLRHPYWGYADVHRMFPGIGVAPDEAFEVLWAGRTAMDIAGVPCTVPDRVGQTVLLVLNAGRTPTGGVIARDVATSWGRADDAERRTVQALVRRLDADLAFAAGTGHLDDFRGRRDYPLWKVMSQGGTRLEEWRARIAAQPTRRDRLSLVLRMPLVNVEHLTVLLGRHPTRREIVREFFRRPVRGVLEQAAARARRRSTSDPGGDADARATAGAEAPAADPSEGAPADTAGAAGPAGTVTDGRHPDSRGHRLSPGVGAVEVDGVVYAARVPEGPIRVLAGSAAVIWDTLLDEDPSPVVDRVAAAFDLAPDDVRASVEGLVDEVVGAGLLTPR